MSDSISKALSRVLKGEHTVSAELDLDTQNRYIILSDQHKGAGDKADEFDLCRATYRAALMHYLERGYTLIGLGDCEELWENSFREIFAQHGEILDLERAFGKGRYRRVWGNHDDRWNNRWLVSRELRPLLPADVDPVEAIRFRVLKRGTELGTMILLHGHQGTWDSDKFAGPAKWALRFFWRPVVQNFIGLGRQSPSQSVEISGEHEKQMRDWALGNPKLMLIAGHTHKAVWPAPTDRPCYVNTGCCKFSDGSISGVEIEGGTMHLIRWSDPFQGPTRLRSESLYAMFGRL